MSNFTYSPFNYVNKDFLYAISTSAGPIAAANTGWLTDYKYVATTRDAVTEVAPGTAAIPGRMTSALFGFDHDTARPKIGCVVLGNVTVANNATIRVTLTINGSTIINNEIIYQSGGSDYSNIYQKLAIGTSNIVFKHIPIYLSPTVQHTLSPGSQVSISVSSSVSNSVSIGYFWVGDLLTTDTGVKRPTSISLSSANESTELENGDNVLNTAYYKRQADYVFENATDRDTNLMQYTLANGSTYYISCFNPFGAICLPSSGVATRKDIDTWLDHSGLFMMNTSLSTSRKFYQLSNFTLKFKEVI